MRTISDADQLARIASSSLAAIQLIKITTYTDRGALTEGTIFYIAKDSADYDYGDAGTDRFFRPWLVSVEPLVSSMVYMPGGGDGLTAKAINVNLHNSEYQGSRVAALLAAATGPLEGATIEVAELFVDEQTAPPIDLTGLAGDEHITWWSGVIDRVRTSNSTVTLECLTEIPQPRWPTMVDQSAVSPRDAGDRWPIPYGIDTIVRCPGITVGFVTTTTTPITSATYLGSIGVASTSGFPGGTFQVRIGREVLDVSVTDSRTLEIEGSGRANLGTIAVVHGAGIPCSEVLTTSSYAVSRYLCEDLIAAYYRDRTGALIEIPTFYSFNPENTSAIPGETVSTVDFTASQMNNLADFIAGQGHAEIETGDEPTTPSPEEDYVTGGTLGANAHDQDDGTYIVHSWPVAGYTATFSPFTGVGGQGMASQTIRIRLGNRSNINSYKIYAGLDSSAHMIRKIDNSEIPSGSPVWFEFAASVDQDEFYLRVKYDNSSSGTVRVYEFERLVQELPAPPTPAVLGDPIPAETAAFMLSNDIELYARVNGIAGPTPPWDDLHDFESGSWSALNLSAALTSGAFSGSKKLECVLDPDAEMTVLMDGSSTTGWTDSNGTITVQNGTIFVDADSAAACWGRYDHGSNVDLSDTGSGIKYVVFRYLDNHASSGFNGNLEFRLYDSSGNYIQFDFDSADGPAGTQGYIFLDHTKTPDSSSGSFNPAVFREFRVRFNIGGTQSAAAYASIDNLGTLPISTNELNYIAQNNGMGGVDFSAENDQYRIALKKPGGTLFQADPRSDFVKFELVITDEVVAGTTMPTSYRRIPFDITPVDPTFRQFESGVHSDVNSPDVTNVKTLRLEIEWGDLHGIWEDITTDLELHVDLFQAEGAFSNPYEADNGEVLEKPVDVARHWIAEFGGATVNDASFTAANSNLGSNVLSGDARGWGADFASVLAHIGYITRSNFVFEEFPTGQEVKMLCAESDYTWPASGGTLDQFRPDGVEEGGRDRGRDLFSGRTFLYAYQPNLGTGDEGFTKAIRIGSDTNDASAKVSAGTISAAIAAFGDRDAPVAFLLGIADDDTAIEIAGYIYTEGARIDAPIIKIADLSWSQGTELEAGDIRSMTRPWIAGALKLRLIEITKDFESQRYEVRGVVVT